MVTHLTIIVAMVGLPGVRFIKITIIGHLAVQGEVIKDCIGSAGGEMC